MDTKTLQKKFSELRSNTPRVWTDLQYLRLMSRHARYLFNTANGPWEDRKEHFFEQVKALNKHRTRIIKRSKQWGAVNAKKIAWTRYPYGWQGMSRKQVQELNRSRDEAWRTFYTDSPETIHRWSDQ